MKAYLAAALFLHAGGAALVWTTWSQGAPLPLPVSGVDVSLVRLQPRTTPVPNAMPAAVPPPHGPPVQAVTAGIETTATESSDFSPARLPDGFTVAYPVAARIGTGKQGSALFEVEVAATGQVAGLSLTRSTGHGILDQAAADQLARTRLEPAVLDGRAVSSRTLITIEFRLE